jgi:sarcosine oxidase delta subunit
MKLHEAFSPDESKKIYDNFLAIVNDPKRRDRLVRKYGKNAENVAYGTAVNQVKKQAANNIEEPTTEEPMEDVKLKEMVKAALSNPKAADLNKDGELSNYEKKRGAAIEKSMAKKGVNEDLDLGHEDNEPHMIKSELYRIGKYAMELYKMVDQFEGEQEVDFPAWWQSKITTAKNMISSAKHYLEFELQEPQIDAMVGVASEEGAIDENIDDIDYRNRNNVMRGIYDLAEKSKDVESFKDKWYKTYSRGLQDKDADTDEWLETIFRRVNKSSKSIDEKLKPSMGAGAYVKDFRKSDAPQFDNKSKAKKDKMAVAAYLSAKDKTKKKIKEAILAKLKNK